MATQADLITGVKEIVQDSAFASTRILKYLNQAQRHIAGGVYLQYPDRTQILSSPLPDLITDDDLTTSTTLPYISLPSDFGRNLFFLYSSTNDIEIEVYDSLTELLRIYPGLDDTNRVVAAAIRGSRLYYQGYPSTAETLQAHYHRVPTDMATLTGSSDITFTASTLRIADPGNGLGVFSAGQTIDITGTTNNNTSFEIASVESDGSYLTTTVAPTDESGQSATIKSRPLGIPVHLQEALLENFVAWKIFERKTREVTTSWAGGQRTANYQMSKEAERYHGLFMGAMLEMEASIEAVPGSVRFMFE